MKRTITSLILLAVVATACGADDASDTTVSPNSTTVAPDGPARVLLSMADEGGFMMLEFALNRPPTYTLLTDGTLIFQGPQVGAFPGPVMPGMQQVKLTADQMKDVQVLIDAIGLPEIDDLVNDDAAQFVADATSTVATYFDDDGGTHRVSVYALGITDELPDDLANLALLRDTLGGFVNEGTAGAPYASDELIIHVIQGNGIGDEFDDTRPWDFAFEPGIEPGANNQFPCQVMTGDDAVAMRTTMADVTQATKWEHDSGTFTVLARDLMPGETGCDSQ